MNADSGIALKALKVDGGMTANNLLMQFMADLLDVPLVRPMVTETVSLGAAYAAGLAVGKPPSNAPSTGSAPTEATRRAGSDE